MISAAITTPWPLSPNQRRPLQLMERRLLSDPIFEHVSPDAPAEHAHKINLDHDNTHFTSPWDPENTAGFVGKQGGPETFNQTETWTPFGLVRGGIHGGNGELLERGSGTHMNCDYAALCHRSQ